MAAPPRLGWVRITSADPPLSVTARLWDERPNVTSGYGGWEEVERPRRSPITSWKNQPGLRLTLPVVLDRHTSGNSVEPAITALSRMGRPTAADGEPPQVRISALGSAVPFQDRLWVVAELDWGDALMNQYGNRTRQQVTLTLLEYVEDVYLQQRSAANRRRMKKRKSKKKKGAAAKRIVAKRSTKKKRSSQWAGTYVSTSTYSNELDSYGQGEDLLEIAARELGDASRWVEIAELNGLRDPRAITPGQVLRLP